MLKVTRDEGLVHAEQKALVAAVAVAHGDFPARAELWNNGGGIDERSEEREGDDDGHELVHSFGEVVVGDVR